MFFMGKKSNLNERLRRLKSGFQDFELLIERIPRRGMSKKFQEKLPQVFRGYLKKEPEDRLISKFPQYGRCIERIYPRLEQMINQIKVDSLNNICGIMGRNPISHKDDVEYVDTVITFCTQYSGKKSGLNKRIFKVFNTLSKKDQDTLYKRYKDGKKNIEDRSALQNLSEELDIYAFVVNERLDRK